MRDRSHFQNQPSRHFRSLVFSNAFWCLAVLGSLIDGGDLGSAKYIPPQDGGEKQAAGEDEVV